MQSIRPSYPRIIRIGMLLATISVVVFAVGWAGRISGLELNPFIVYGVGVIAGVLLSSNTIPTVIRESQSIRFDFNTRQIKVPGGRVISFDDITKVTVKTATSKWVKGAEMYEMSFYYGPSERNKFTIVDTRLFFKPYDIGYSPKEVKTIFRFLQDDGFQGDSLAAVELLAERLRIKE